MIKATGTGAAAAPPRSPRIKTGVDTDEGEQGMKDGNIDIFLWQESVMKFMQHELYGI